MFEKRSLSDAWSRKEGLLVSYCHGHSHRNVRNTFKFSDCSAQKEYKHVYSSELKFQFKICKCKILSNDISFSLWFC